MVEYRNVFNDNRFIMNYKEIEKRERVLKRMREYSAIWYQKNRKKHLIACKNRYIKDKNYRENLIERTIERNKKYNFVYKSRQTLRNAVYRGKIKKEPCEVCGKIRVCGHHKDYSKPLEVNWLCSTHHGQIHRKYEAINI